ERPAERGRDDRSVGLGPLRQGRVARVVDGSKERTALVVTAALRGRQGSPQHFTLLGGGGQVVDRGRVVPAHLLGRLPAGQVERVHARAVAVAGGARIREHRVRDALEVGEIRGRWIGVWVKPVRGGN